ncbi:hypothetical protein SAMN04487787_106254 [Kosakonia sacchari]|nr:hypothetical protein SAMN04487787_106254 [Kosakonia sacchari]
MIALPGNVPDGANAYPAYDRSSSKLFRLERAWIVGPISEAPPGIAPE